jgi:hypothetical protein
MYEMVPNALGKSGAAKSVVALASVRHPFGVVSLSVTKLPLSESVPYF